MCNDLEIVVLSNTNEVRLIKSSKFHERNIYFDENHIRYRKCSREDCQKILLEIDNFYPKIRNGRSGFDIHCKECRKKQRKDIYNQNDYGKAYNTSEAGRVSKKKYEERQELLDPEGFKARVLERTAKSRAKHKEKNKTKTLNRRI